MHYHTCLLYTSNPNWFTAAAESPPPMIVVASVSAKAFATAMVPAASVGSVSYTHLDVYKRQMYCNKFSA